VKRLGLRNQKQGIDKTIEDIRNTLFHEFIPYSHAVIDEGGVGGGVVDGLKGIRGFTGNNAPFQKEEQVEDGKRKENYRNLRSQCAFKLAEKINKHELAISAKISETDRENVIEEIRQLKRKDSADDAPLQLILKEDMIENLGHSPDFLDMMIMRMYFEVAPSHEFYMPNLELVGFGGVKPIIEGVG